MTGFDWSLSNHAGLSSASSCETACLNWQSAHPTLPGDQEAKDGVNPAVPSDTWPCNKLS